MLNELLKIVTPEAVAQAVRENPKVIQRTLQSFNCYKTFGQTLSTEQQVCLSNNLHQLDSFFKTDVGVDCIQNLMSNFIKHTEK
jgi:hypothetical protein